MLPDGILVFKNVKQLIINISSKLAYRKSQRSFMDLALQSDICSSIRPKIGKVFVDPNLENLKQQHLDDCRKKLIEICIIEADSDLLSLKSTFKDVLTNSQNDLDKKQLLAVSKLAKHRVEDSKTTEN